MTRITADAVRAVLAQGDELPDDFGELPDVEAESFFPPDFDPNSEKHRLPEDIVEELTPKDCKRCGEDACSIWLSKDEYFVRVRRISKCKRYTPPRHRYGFMNRDGICQTELCPTEKGAVEAWNEKYG